MGLTKNGSGKFRLTGKALQVVAFCCTMITAAVGTWVKLGGGGGLAGACGGAGVVGIDRKWLFECAFLAVVASYSVLEERLSTGDAQRTLVGTFLIPCVV